MILDWLKAQDFCYQHPLLLYFFSLSFWNICCPPAYNWSFWRGVQRASRGWWVDYALCGRSETALPFSVLSYCFFQLLWTRRYLDWPYETAIISKDPGTATDGHADWVIHYHSGVGLELQMNHCLFHPILPPVFLSGRRDHSVDFKVFVKVTQKLGIPF